MKKHPIEKDRPSKIKLDGHDWRFAFADLIEHFSEAGATLRGFRLREGLTQAELAKKIGIDQANVSKMERGKRSIGKVIAKKLGVFFSTDYRVFL